MKKKERQAGWVWIDVWDRLKFPAQRGPSAGCSHILRICCGLQQQGWRVPGGGALSTRTAQVVEAQEGLW